MAFDASGNLYVANVNANTIYKFTPPFTPPNTNGTLFAITGNNPTALAFDASGNLYCANSGDGTIQKITSGGAVSTFANGLNIPTALTFDDQNNLYCANSGDQTIYQFTLPSGTGTLFATNNLNNPYGMVFYNSNPDATNNAAWQIQSQSFTATQTGTPLVLDATGGSFLTSGLLTNNFANNQLFDAFSLTQIPSDLDYFAEQSLEPLTGASALGTWQLEVLDNRAGATNPSPVLVSWRLEFIFANTNVPLPTLLGFIPQTNQVPANSIYWYQVNIPASANFATNLLLFADLPVNLWYSANNPPTITNATDVLLLGNSTSGIGNPILSTNTMPLLVPNTTYYLGVQNSNAVPVNAGVEVDFDHGNAAGSGGPPRVHFSVVRLNHGHPQLQWPSKTGATYAVQWKNSLTTSWNTLYTPNSTTVNGVTSFTDDGSQTAPLTTARFYRLVELPPAGFRRIGLR